MHNAVGERLSSRFYRELHGKMMLNTPLPVASTAADVSASLQVEVMQGLVDDILARLIRANIPYCLLRNRDAIPHELLEWGDLDILVSGDVTARQLIDLYESLEPAQIVPIREGLISFFFPAGEVFLRVDMFLGNMEWRGADYLDSQEVLSMRWDDRGYMVAAPIHQAYIAWFSKLLWAGFFPDRYATMISQAARRQPDAFHNLLERAFGSRLADQLLDLAVNDRLPESIVFRAECCRALWLGELRRHPTRAPLAFFRQIQNAVVQTVHPSGLDVAFLGPDGAGKTTVASLIATLPARRIAFGGAQHQLLYRRVLPPFSRIASKALRKRVAPVSDPLNPHNIPAHRTGVWVMKFVYYAVDQWLEQVWLRRQMAHTQLILKDRHLIELPIDARRYRYNGPAAFTRLISQLIPKPGMVIVLEAPTDVLQARKQEVPFLETARQRQAYLALAEQYQHCHVVNTNQPIEDVLQDSLHAINHHVAYRTRQRFYPEHSSPFGKRASGATPLRDRARMRGKA